MTNGKGDKNRLKGDSLKAYSESKLWDNIARKPDLIVCISCHKKVSSHISVYVLENKELYFCPDCVGCYTVAEIWEMQDKKESKK